MILRESFTIKEIKSLMTQLAIVFDVVRLVDPVTNLVLTYDEYGNKHLDEKKCYEIWGKKKACDNCLSLSSVYKCKTRQTKYEFIDKDVFYVVSYPVKLDDMYSNDSLVLEIVSNVTDEIFFEAFGRDDIIEKITQRNRIFYEDSLTAVYNRRFLDDGIFCKQQYRVLGRCAVFIMMDISRFKHINDTYGHEHGDEVLKQVGSVLSSSIRGNDLVIRYGGDEFLIILPGCQEDMAAKKIEHFKNKLSEIVYDEEQDLRLQANFGFSYCDIFKNDDKIIHALISLADVRMYEEKKASHAKENIIANR